MSVAPVLGAIGDTAYNFLLAAHLLAAIAAFGPTLVYTLLGRLSTRLRGEAAAQVASVAPALNKRVSLPALTIAVVAGMGLIVESDEAYTFDMPWISASFTLTLLLGLVSWFFLAPALRRLQAVVSSEESDEQELRRARAAAAMATGLFHASLIALIVLMVWKPT